MRSNRGKRRDDAGPASPRRHRLVKLLALLAALMFLAAACGGNDSDDDSAGEDTSSDATDDFAVSAAEDTEEGFDGATATTFAPDVGDRTETEDLADSDVDGDAATDEEGDGGDRLGAGGATVTPTAADIGRKLIFTAHVHVEVDDVAAASAEATSIVQGMGGFVFGQNTSGGSEPSSELVFKILPEDFNRALEALGNVGELRNQSVTTDDVTERIVDLESRIQVSQLGVERLRAALEGAATLEDYAEIERLLLDRESNLEVMRGQLRTLEDRVDLATITLLLTQDRVENFIDLTISAYEAHDNGESCPGQGGYSLEAGSDVTICFEVFNQGDQTLTDITLTDTVLEIDADSELIPVFGALDELAPGQTALVAYQLNPERDLRMRTRVTAIPTDGVSSEPAGPTVSAQVSFDLNTFEPDEDPGFGDGFSAAVDILKGIWIGLTVSVGFLILPLLVLVPLVWLGRRGWREYRRRRPPRPRPGAPGRGPIPSGYQPPPPAPNPVPAPAPDSQAGGTSGSTTPQS